MDLLTIKTFGALKKAGYRTRGIKDELRANLEAKLRKRQTAFEGIIGFDETVIPDLETALLSRHNILLLGVRRHAKTRIARMMTGLLEDRQIIRLNSSH